MRPLIRQAAQASWSWAFLRSLLNLSAIRHERQMEGSARAKGRTGGRPKAVTDAIARDIHARRSDGESFRSIAKSVGFSVATVQNVLKAEDAAKGVGMWVRIKGRKACRTRRNIGINHAAFSAFPAAAQGGRHRLKPWSSSPNCINGKCGRREALRDAAWRRALINFAGLEYPL